MTEINSPISRLKLAQQSQRRFTVPQGHEDHDHQSFEEPSISEIEQKIIQARHDKAKGIERLSPEAKKRVELVTGIGRLEKDVQIDDVTFTLRTIKSREMKEAMLSLIGIQYELEATFEKRRQLVARSLHKINGVELLLFLGDDSLESRLSFVDELDEYVTSKLFEEYVSLANEATEKYTPKTLDEAKEVAEEIKK